LAGDQNEVKAGAIMVKGSSIARLKKRAQQALEKNPRDRTYKEVKDISNWMAVKERWEDMKGNQYAVGIVRSEKTREKMREAQRMRRKKEVQERMRNIKVRTSSASSED
jgi:hypothetical protein